MHDTEKKLGEAGALLHEEWCAGIDGNVIVGTWAEDGTPYNILVPPQLRPQIIWMQNVLHRLYTQYTTASTAYKLARKNIADILWVD